MSRGSAANRRNWRPIRRIEGGGRVATRSRGAEIGSRPRICHLNLASGFRGGERQTQLLIESLAALAYPQRLVARRGSALASACRDIPDLQVRGVASNPLAAAWASRGSALLHAHEARAIYACWLLHRFTGAPYLLTRRVDNPFRPSLLRDSAYRSASRIVAVSSAIARIVDARYGAGRCAIVADAHSNLAVGHSLPEALRKRFAGKFVIGHIGALDHSHKGQGTIIEAARRARKAHPHWQFVMLGDGRDEAMLRAAAADLDNVALEGFVSNVADWLALFDVFVFPSLHEGLGSILLDAMAFGLPIVATRVGGIPDIVEHGVNGLLIEPLDAGALLDSIERIMNDSLLSDRLRGAALDRAGSYSPEVMARAYATLYDEMLGEAS